MLCSSSVGILPSVIQSCCLARASNPTRRFVSQTFAYLFSAYCPTTDSLHVAIVHCHHPIPRRLAMFKCPSIFPHYLVFHLGASLFDPVDFLFPRSHPTFRSFRVGFYKLARRICRGGSRSIFGVSLEVEVNPGSTAVAPSTSTAILAHATEYLLSTDSSNLPSLHTPSTGGNPAFFLALQPSLWLKILPPSWKS